MKRIMSILVIIMGCGLCQAQPLVTWSWQPSEHERNMALMLTEHYCRYRLSDQIRQQQQSQELVILKRYSIPEEFEVGNIKYSTYLRRCVPFIVRDFDGSERKFIAVQHIVPSDEIDKDFTLYFDPESGYVGFQLGETSIGGSAPPYWQPRPSTNNVRPRILMSTNINLGGRGLGKPAVLPGNL